MSCSQWQSGLHRKRTHKSPGNIVQIKEVKPDILTGILKGFDLLDDVTDNFFGAVCLGGILIGKAVNPADVPLPWGNRIISTDLCGHISGIVKIFCQDFGVFHKVKAIVLHKVHVMTGVFSSPVGCNGRQSPFGTRVIIITDNAFGKISESFRHQCFKTEIFDQIIIKTIDKNA